MAVFIKVVSSSEVGFVLDCSGSTDPIADSAINGFSEQQKIAPQSCFSLSLSNDHVRAIHDVPPLSPFLDCPCGGTALNDAIGQMIGQFGQRPNALPGLDRDLD